MIMQRDVELSLIVLGIFLIASNLDAQEKNKKDRPQLKDFLEEKVDPPRPFFSSGGSIISFNALEKSIEVVGVPKNIKVIVNDEVKVRKLYPPNPYVDEKGKQRQPTDKELKELKGDLSLPGFSARFADLKSARAVLIYIVDKKDPRPKVVLIDNEGENILHANEPIFGAEDKEKKEPPVANINPRKFWNSSGRIKSIDSQEKSIELVLRPGDSPGSNKVMMLDDVKIRKAHPPIAYDEKGWRREHTEKELKELKGDANLPGFTADFEDLQPDREVAINIVRKKIGNTTKLRAKVIVINNLEEELRHPVLFPFFGSGSGVEWWKRVR
jgi:hypothetical protein